MSIFVGANPIKNIVNQDITMLNFVSKFNLSLICIIAFTASVSAQNADPSRDDNRIIVNDTALYRNIKNSKRNKDNEFDILNQIFRHRFFDSSKPINYKNNAHNREIGIKYSTIHKIIIKKQIESVDMDCLSPKLMQLIHEAGIHFGNIPVITSGKRNSGRSGSLHRYCKAADFFIPGVSNHALASFLRKQPEAGGVGIYCHTKSVHLDIGEPRNWSQCGFRVHFAQR